MRYVYSLILYLLTPLLPLYLKCRSKKNPEYNYNWQERFGLRLKNPTTQPIIWLHAVSVGEIRAAAKLIQLLGTKYPEYRILVTQMTPTGRNTAKLLYPEAILHYMPYDLPHAVINFYTTFKPKICLIMETEIWPNLVHYANQYKIPIFLVNARLSEKSFSAYAKIGWLIKPILNKFSAILSQDAATQASFIKLGFSGPSVVIGSTKFDITLDQQQVILAKELKQNIGDKKVVIFASTREGEERLIINYIQKQNYLVVIVPRHIERFGTVEQILLKNNINYVKRSENKLIQNNTQVFLGDSMNEMFMYYAMADIAVMGGSFNDFGGQNLIEPILLHKPVILGPSIFNFVKIAGDAVTEGCAIQVDDITQCFATIDDLLSNEAKYKTLVNKCESFSQNFQGASQKVVDLVSQYF